MACTFSSDSYLTMTTTSSSHGTKCTRDCPAGDRRCARMLPTASIFLLLLLLALSTASCPTSLECMTGQNCRLLLGNRINSFTLFPCGSKNENVCCPVLQNTSSPAPYLQDRLQLLPLDVCGISTDNRIIGGENASVGQFPWMALLGFHVNNTGPVKYICGGSVISDRYILTAAHCLTIETTTLVSVRVGELDLNTDPDCESLCNDTHCQSICADCVQDIEVEEIIIHDGFNHDFLKNDIALIRLKRNITTFESDYVRPLCLPFGLNVTGFEEIKYLIAGWGKLDHYDRTGSSVLQFATIQSVPLDDCDLLQLEEVRPLDETQLCAGNIRGRDACKGDSGGPLMHTEFSTGKLYQVGIVSFGSVPCGGQDAPSVYTRVTTFLNWILENIRK